MRFLRLSVLVLAVALPAMPASADAASRYRGTLVDFAGAAQHDTFMGDDHILRFFDRNKMRTRYRVCLRGGDDKINRCFTRRTSSSGHSKVNVSSEVNAYGGPGKYTARWYVSGRRVAIWKFTAEDQPGESLYQD